MQIERKVALVVEDHEIFRMGLVAILRRDCGFQTVVEAGSLDEAIQRLGENTDITFATFDLAMPGMLSVSSLYSVRQIFPDLGVAVVTGSERREDIITAVNCGVHGYVTKTLNTAQIAAALNTVLNGSIFLPWSIARLPPSSDFPSGPELSSFSSSNPSLKLTNRQQDVLRLIREGKSNKEIGLALGLTESTVKVHANALYRALGVNSRAGAASSQMG